MFNVVFFVSGALLIVCCSYLDFILLTWPDGPNIVIHIIDADGPTNVIHTIDADGPTTVIHTIDTDGCLHREPPDGDLCDTGIHPAARARSYHSVPRTGCGMCI